MELRRNRIVPVVGGVTAAATAVGAFAPATQVAVAAPDHADHAVGAAGVSQDGVYESCSAYFGFGKEDDTFGMVDFVVDDVNGADGVAHDVPDDVDVVLVLENEEDEVLECVPEEVSEEDWATFTDGGIDFPAMPVWPGAKRFAYPNPSLEPTIDEFGTVTEVGFRVIGVPSDHTLVSPEGVRPLVDHFTFLGALFGGTPDASLLVDAVEAAAGTAAADALDAAIQACADEGTPDLTGDDLMAAIEAVAALLGYDGETPPDALDCDDIFEIFVIGSYGVAMLATADYQELIELSVTEPTPTSTPTSTPAPPAAQAAQAARATPSYTG